MDELEVRERPPVIFRPSENTWLEAIVRYLAPPREAGSIKTRLIPKLLAALNAEPDKACSQRETRVDQAAFLFAQRSTIASARK